MGITSLNFLILSIISIYIYYLINNKYRALFLAFLSCGFIATYSYNLLFYVIIYALFNFLIGLKIPEVSFKKNFFRIGIIINLSQLVILKYASFTIDPFFKLVDTDISFSGLAEIIVPVGISFFTLQGISYLINVYRGWEEPEKNFIHFLTYVSFFPKFLSGPVERSDHFLPQIKISKTFDSSIVISGLRIVLLGIFKKVVIADQLASLINNSYANIQHINETSSWIVLFIQPLYLYFDFSGYTDIAIGLARTFGIQLIPNFNRPFMSENMTTFWKRFHISLSSWFHDYVFRPLSFKYRKWGIYASVFAVFITWVLFGIWHGAGWNFMILGFLQALAINFEFFTKKWRNKVFSSTPILLRIWMGRVIAYAFYSITLVFFFASDIHSAFTWLEKLSGGGGIFFGQIRKEIFFLVSAFMALFLIIEIISEDFKNIASRLEVFFKSNEIKYRILRWSFYLLMISIIFVLNNEAQQFIYFQF